MYLTEEEINIHIIIKNSFLLKKKQQRKLLHEN